MFLVSNKSILTRLPLAGANIEHYDKGRRGGVAKATAVLAKISLIAISCFVILNLYPHGITTYALWGLPLITCLAMAFGSNFKRTKGELFFEFAVAAVCTALAILSQEKILSHFQVGIGTLVTICGGVLIASTFEKSFFKRVELDVSSHRSLTPYKCFVKNENSFEDDLFDPNNSLLPVRVYDLALGWFKDFNFKICNVFSRVSHRKNYSKKINDSAAALCVFVPGLNDHPSIFDSYHDEFTKHLGKKITLYQPYVQNKGNCPLEDATAAIYKKVLKWATANPKKPIILIGASNGARIVASISAQLSSNENLSNPILVECLSAPFSGTKKVNHPEWPKCLQKIWRWVFIKRYSEAVYKELSWDDSNASHALFEGKRKSSPVSKGQELIVHMVDAAESGKVNYQFFATASSTEVNPYISSIPNIPKAKMYCTSGEGDLSIIRAAQDRIVQNSLEFIYPKQMALLKKRVKKSRAKWYKEHLEG